MGITRIGDVDKAATMPKAPRKPLKVEGDVRRDKRGRPWRPRPQNKPKHHPTLETRAAVQALNAGGFTHEQIADYLRYMLKSPISARSVARFYRTELKIGKTHQVLVASQTMFRKAVGSPAQFDGAGNMIRAEVKPETVANIFWLKAQAGWRDHQTVTIDPDQKPIPVSIASLTDRQLDELEQRLLDRVDQRRAPPRQLALPAK